MQWLDGWFCYSRNRTRAFGMTRGHSTNQQKYRITNAHAISSAGLLAAIYASCCSIFSVSSVRSSRFLLTFYSRHSSTPNIQHPSSDLTWELLEDRFAGHKREPQPRQNCSRQTMSRSDETPSGFPSPGEDNKSPLSSHPNTTTREGSCCFRREALCPLDMPIAQVPTIW